MKQKLLSGEADLAVHSLKDVPSEMHPYLLLAAFTEREDVHAFKRAGADLILTYWAELVADELKKG